MKKYILGNFSRNFVVLDFHKYKHILYRIQWIEIAAILIHCFRYRIYSKRHFFTKPVGAHENTLSNPKKCTSKGVLPVKDRRLYTVYPYLWEPFLHCASWKFFTFLTFKNSRFKNKPNMNYKFFHNKIMKLLAVVD